MAWKEVVGSGLVVVVVAWILVDGVGSGRRLVVVDFGRVRGRVGEEREMKMNDLIDPFNLSKIITG